MKKIIIVLTAIAFVASPAIAKRFYFPGEKTEVQKKREARERYEERYQKKLDYLYLQDYENLIEYKRKKRELKIKEQERGLESKIYHPTQRPATGPYLKK
jgi:hypothetical protein